jgi:hypothetical protein
MLLVTATVIMQGDHHEPILVTRKQTLKVTSQRIVVAQTNVCDGVLYHTWTSSHVSEYLTKVRVEKITFKKNSLQ